MPDLKKQLEWARKLVTKRDARIAELERDVVGLNSELANQAWVTPSFENTALSNKCAELEAQLTALRAENERLQSAINETLELADFLNDIAASGAGFGEHWGERVMQAVEALRDTKAFASKTLEHNRILLESNSQFIRERDEAIAQRDAKIAELEAARELITLVCRDIQAKIDDDDNPIGKYMSGEYWARMCAIASAIKEGK